MILDRVNYPKDLKNLSFTELNTLVEEHVATYTSALAKMGAKLI